MPATIGAYTEVDICNLALAELGRGGQIAAMDEQSQSARMVVLRYPYSRDAVLRAYDWNFATARATLPQNPVTPGWEYAWAYDLPEDCLLVREVYMADALMWKIEGRQILTNIGECLITYTKLVTDPTIFDPLFVNALACRIAADIAVTLTESSTRAEGLWRIYRDKLQEARRRDAQEGQPDRFPQGSWVDSRWSF